MRACGCVGACPCAQLLAQQPPPTHKLTQMTHLADQPIPGRLLQGLPSGVALGPRRAVPVDADIPAGKRDPGDRAGPAAGALRGRAHRPGGGGAGAARRARALGQLQACGARPRALQLRCARRPPPLCPPHPAPTPTPLGPVRRARAALRRASHALGRHAQRAQPGGGARRRRAAC